VEEVGRVLAAGNLLVKSSSVDIVDSFSDSGVEGRLSRGYGVNGRSLHNDAWLLRKRRAGQGMNVRDGIVGYGEVVRYVAVVEDGAVCDG
jgi:hypothetical protein